MPNFKIQNKKKSKRHKHKKKSSKRKNQHKRNENNNNIHKIKNSKINHANCFASKPFLKSLYPETNCSILTEYHQLTNPSPTFNHEVEMKMSTKNNDITYDILKKILCDYLSPTLTQFYAYNQSLHQYDHAGVIAIETKPDDKLKDLLKISKKGTEVDFRQNKMLSVVYIPDEETLISYFKEIEIKQNEYAAFLQVPMSCKNDTLNMWRKDYFPLFINIQADNFYDMIYQKQRTSTINTPFEALLFKQNMIQSGVERCSLLNIQLKEQITFGMDCMPTISPTNT